MSLHEPDRVKVSLYEPDRVKVSLLPLSSASNLFHPRLKTPGRLPEERTKFFFVRGPCLCTTFSYCSSVGS